MKKDIKKILKIFTFISSIFFILFFILVFTNISSAYERVPSNDGLTAPWHNGGYCIPCHYSLMNIEKAQNISYNCGCHTYRPKGETSGYKIDMDKITDIHKDIICIRCHIGMKDQKNISAQDFHRIMQIECSDCHAISNNTYKIPEKKNCSDCHANGNPHIVHKEKVAKICIACHGEDFAKKYINKTILVDEKNMTIIVKPEQVKEYPTISKLLNNILKTIMGE